MIPGPGTSICRRYSPHKKFLQLISKLPTSSACNSKRAALCHPDVPHLAHLREQLGPLRSRAAIILLLRNKGTARCFGAPLHPSFPCTPALPRGVRELVCEKHLVWNQRSRGHHVQPMTMATPAILARAPLHSATWASTAASLHRMTY